MLTKTRGEACVVDPNNVSQNHVTPSQPIPVTTLDMIPPRPAQLTYILFISPGCTDCTGGGDESWSQWAKDWAKYVDDRYIAPHSFYVQVSIDPEIAVPFGLAVGLPVEADLVPLIIAFNPR